MAYGVNKEVRDKTFEVRDQDMKRILFVPVVWCLLVPAIAAGQVSYNDVAVIVNTNSAASQTIGNYFKLRRNIPAANMIYVQADTVEEIDSTQFNQLRAQIENHLVANNLQNSINYLVTTKGVPLKVNRGSTYSTTSPSSSVESELMLILGSYSSYIGGAGPQMNPYFYQTTSFSRAAYGIYLVTRLDAYTVQDVIALIDRSGPNVLVDPAAPFLFDQDPAWTSPLNTYMARARNTLVNKGKVVTLDSTSVYLTNRQNLLGYMSWGSNDHYQHLYTQYAIPYNTYAPGAIAETYVSTSGRSFENPPHYGQSLIVDLLAEGVSGAKGYVYEPFSNAMAHAYILYDRYTSGYNLAESYFMASLLVSWMDVVVGDPKTSITFAQGPLPVQLASFTATVLPQGGGVEFRWRTISEVNNYGFYLQRADTTSSVFEDVPDSFVPGHGTTLIPQDYAWTYTAAPAGTYYYRLRQVDLDGTSHFSDRIVVTRTTPTDVREDARAAAFRLEQNYPNPFNPATTITFTMNEGGLATLTVFDVTGREVASLVNEVLSAGTHRRTFDASGLASGVYYYRLRVGDRVESKRMMLVK